MIAYAKRKLTPQEQIEIELKHRNYGLNGDLFTINYRLRGLAEKICKTQKSVLAEDNKVIRLLCTL